MCVPIHTDPQIHMGSEPLFPSSESCLEANSSLNSVFILPEKVQSNTFTKSS